MPNEPGKCAACGRRPVRSNSTGELRGWRYSDGRVCSLRCVETLVECLLVVEINSRGGLGITLADALRVSREETLRIRQQDRGELRASAGPKGGGADADN